MYLLEIIRIFSIKFVKSDSCVSSESLDEKGKSKKTLELGMFPWLEKSWT